MLPVSDEQLAVIEQRRAAADLTFWLDTNVVLGYDPAVADGDHNDRWPARQAQDSVAVQGEVWERLLTQANAGMSLAVVVPVPLDRNTAGRAGAHLREAIRKLNTGEYSDAVTEARKAMEAAGDPDRTWKATQAALEVAKDSRSLGERMTIAGYAMYGLASPAAHGGENASTRPHRPLWRGRSLSVAPDDNWLASGSRDETVRIWDAATWRVQGRMSGDP